ncbi:MAG: ABC transporter, substrate-binding protein (cluster 1, maltose/g3p/polyamine/iron) [uncultured Thermomicrobiales bacterium]|uniref:ABC transporter, substrate-binding protein (Cluster 1, maltose/g3p/polyamine/iron) n=1 Tax=uncultured Thermomicrobiales bacterium TaxID=1645740 RepID=A0A6J4V6Q9_9BACT|nr:MAG: ABC transporter, substrate-binding protein (cluster 1, maltose/g3p/polyamine/iron) [uncultured Thermomicrobiales bacterium]
MMDRQRMLQEAMNRRRMLKLGAGGAALAGGVGLPTGLGRRPGAVLAAQEGAALRFWVPPGSPKFCEIHQEIAADYQATAQGVTFQEVQCLPGEADDYIQAILAAIAAGNPPDGMVIWDTPVSLGARDALLPLDELMAASEHAQVEKWPAGLLASCQYGGATYGLPAVSGLYGLWYNADLLAEKGIPTDRASLPKTWDDLRRMSKEFTVWDGDRLVSAGYIPNNAGWDSETLPIWAALNGGQLYDAENQTYTIDSEPVVEMMEYWVSWLDEEYKGDIGLVRSSAAWGAYVNEEGLPPAFQEGRQAMLLQGSWVMGDFAAEVEPVFTNWNIGNLPVGPSGEAPVSGYWPNWLAIPAGAANPDAAFGYLDYLSAVGAEKWFSAIVDIPTNADAPDVLPQVVVDSRGEEFAQEIMDFWASQAEIATPMWDSPIQSFANDRLRQAVERILTKAAPPAEELASAQADCQAELESVLAG